MSTDTTLPSEMSKVFAELVRPLEAAGSPRLPCMTEMEHKLLAFDLEQRHALAGTRARVKTLDVGALVARLVEDLGKGAALREDSSAKTSRSKRRRKKQRDREEEPVPETERAEPTEKQREMAERLEKLRRESTNASGSASSRGGEETTRRRKRKKDKKRNNKGG